MPPKSQNWGPKAPKMTPKLSQKLVQEGLGGGLEEGLLKKVPTLSSTHYYPYKQQVRRVEKTSFLEALGSKIEPEAGKKGSRKRDPKDTRKSEKTAKKGSPKKYFLGENQ